MYYPTCDVATRVLDIKRIDSSAIVQGWGVKRSFEKLSDPNSHSCVNDPNKQ